MKQAITLEMYKEAGLASLAEKYILPGISHLKAWRSSAKAADKVADMSKALTNAQMAKVYDNHQAKALKKLLEGNTLSRLKSVDEFADKYKVPLALTGMAGTGAIGHSKGRDVGLEEGWGEGAALGLKQGISRGFAEGSNKALASMQQAAANSQPLGFMDRLKTLFTGEDRLDDFSSKLEAARPDIMRRIQAVASSSGARITPESIAKYNPYA